MWDEALKWIPFREDYMSDIGTQRSDDDFNLYKFTLIRLLREFPKGKKISIGFHGNISKKEQIQSLINKNSVLLLNISGQHWVAVVDYDDRHLHIVCSSQLVDKEEYVEFQSPNYNRKYNLFKQYGKLKWLYKSSLICMYVNDA